MSAPGVDPTDWDQADPEQMHDRLAAWARSVAGGSADVGAVSRMPGHSGTTYGFDLHLPGADPQQLVIRVPPLGVRRSGVTDLLRQVPLLRLLEAADVPVPRVRSSGDDERWFGTPYLVVERVEGSMPGDIFAGAVPAPTRERRDVLFDQAIDVLARVHGVDAGALPQGWATPVHLPDLLGHWLRLLERCESPDLIAAGRGLHARLSATVPASRPPTGLVHGDFYQNNWMSCGDRLTAVLDWESAHLGPAPIDAGYVSMMYDPHSWDPALRTDLVDHDRPDHLLARYERASGRPLPHLEWYRALAGLRLGTLTAYFLRLHRTGRRPDDTWETIGPSAAPMFDRAASLRR